jgi:predicted dehydrogenase
MKSELSLGIIGVSDGNGHPYSWAAIFNGYNAASMQKCPFPVIPEYLSKRSFPEDAIDGAKVTHVWTQSPEISRQIAEASCIRTVVTEPQDMIGEVDAVLLARDDAENHFRLAAPFLDAGLPIYIDKPLALTVAEAESIFDRQQWQGQLFSCSALRFAPEFELSDKVRDSLGSPVFVRAISPKGWECYAIHAIDAVLGALGPMGPIDEHSLWKDGAITSLHVRWQSGVLGEFVVSGKGVGPIAVEIRGDRGCFYSEFQDAFTAFRSALSVFVEQIQGPRPHHRSEVMEAIRLLELGVALK